MNSGERLGGANPERRDLASVLFDDLVTNIGPQAFTEMFKSYDKSVAEGLHGITVEFPDEYTHVVSIADDGYVHFRYDGGRYPEALKIEIKEAKKRIEQIATEQASRNQR